MRVSYGTSPQVASPDLDCDRCNYDTHACPGCGASLRHGTEACADCLEQAEVAPRPAGRRVSVGTELVVHTASDTTPGVVYTQKRNAAGVWSCDCRGYQYREDCKHVRRRRGELWP